jgi:hypothetical protein
LDELKKSQKICHAVLKEGKVRIFHKQCVKCQKLFFNYKKHRKKHREQKSLGTKTATRLDFIGGVSGARTPDRWIKSPLLYQLS